VPAVKGFRIPISCVLLKNGRLDLLHGGSDGLSLDGGLEDMEIVVQEGE